MKPPPRKKRSELTVGELRDLERKEEAERQEWDRENEARIKSLDMRTEIQQTIIDNIERDIRICKSKIDDMKEDYRDYERSSTFVDELEELYGELGLLTSKRDVMKHFAFNELLQTDTSHRNPSWRTYQEEYCEATSQYDDGDTPPYRSTINSDPFWSVGIVEEDVLCPKSDYPPTEFGKINYDAQEDRLNKDL